MEGGGYLQFYAVYFLNASSCRWLSGRARRSPKQRVKEQLNGGAREADKDQLICEDGDGVYRRCPGVNNVAYVVGGGGGGWGGLLC